MEGPLDRIIRATHCWDSLFCNNS